MVDGISKAKWFPTKVETMRQRNRNEELILIFTIFSAKIKLRADLIPNNFYQVFIFVTFTRGMIELF